MNIDEIKQRKQELENELNNINFQIQQEENIEKEKLKVATEEKQKIARKLIEEKLKLIYSTLEECTSIADENKVMVEFYVDDSLNADYYPNDRGWYNSTINSNC